MRYGCQKKGTGKAVMKASFGGVASIYDAIGAAVPTSKTKAGLKSTATTQAEKKEGQDQSSPTQMKEGGMPSRNKKNFRSTKSGAGMTQAGVMSYRKKNPGSKLKTAVTGEVKKGSKDAKRRKSFCARSAGQMKKFPKAAKDPNSRLRQARRRWKC